MKTSTDAYERKRKRQRKINERKKTSTDGSKIKAMKGRKRQPTKINKTSTDG